MRITQFRNFGKAGCFESCTSGLGLGVGCNSPLYTTDLKAAVAGTVLWFSSIYVLRLMAKHDPKLRQTYMRHRIYKAYYPTMATPWRNNTDSQGKQYRDPWKIT